MYISSKMFKSTIMLLIFFVLLMSSLYSQNLTFTKKMRKMSNKKMALLSMKILTFLSILNLLIFMIGKGESSMMSIMKWNNKTNLYSSMSMMMDNNFMFFSTAALMVTWSMMEFSMYYMLTDPYNKKFYRLLLIFLLKMLMLTVANNMFLFFIGWEGVGMLSFLLIGWWSTRTNAKSSAIQAMIYKRMGDMGMMILMSSILMKEKSWDMSSMSSMNSNNYYLNLILFSSLLGAIGKSAQFGLHPWLPAAMEGPTPVSALLHSSTMVVAGVFLLMRMTEMIEKQILFQNMTLILGSLTAMFAATSAYQQHDMKKMIAYSTTSQLGLMIISMGLGNPNMALFHICTHAFFKAMLFLCSGSIMHSYKNEQDLRKMSNLTENLPMTTSCLFLGSMSLMGIPFLSGFYSKDLILELFINNSSKLISFTLALIATLLTAAYSFRMMTFCFLKNNSKISLNPMNEENMKLYFPLIRLALGTMLTGWILKTWLFKMPNLFPSNLMKSLPLLLTLIGASIMSTLMIYSNSNKNTKKFFSNLWFYSNMSHIFSNKFFNLISLKYTTRTLDRGWSELMGAQGIFDIKNSATKNNQLTQTGYIKQYLLSMFIIFFSLMIIFIFL